MALAKGERHLNKRNCYHTSQCGHSTTKAVRQSMCYRFFVLGAWGELNYFVFIDILFTRGQQVEREGITFILRPLTALGSGG